MITDINNEDRLVQQTFAEHLEKTLGWESVYAYRAESFGLNGTLGRESEREAVLVRDLRAAVTRLNPDLPGFVVEQAVESIVGVDFSRSLLQHNREYYGFIRDGVPVEWRDEEGAVCYARARVIDFRNPTNNRFLAVREMKIQGQRVPHYNRRADPICFVNGLPLVFIELKAVYRNIRAGFDDNLTDYLSDHSIAHAFHHNAFLVVSNGDQARYGSITSKWEHFVEWKRNAETDKGRVDAEGLLDGMLAKERLLDIVENFILFDDSRAGGTRKIVARNHQVLGVNNAVGSVLRQEELKQKFPPDKRLLEIRVPMPELHKAAGLSPIQSAEPPMTPERAADGELFSLVKRAHPDLGRLGVFWHTQGSGKSYSMAFFAEKVRRAAPGNFTFLVMTDREDLDDQIWRTFIGCGITDEKTPRASSGKELQEILRGNHRFVFSLIHKFNQPVTEHYSERDDIIVISDEAHRTQAGKFARNMRLALPNASFIGFTGTPLFKHDELTRRIFGDYISRYDFKRSEEDQSTVRLVYENRGEKLGIARLDLNDRIADAIERAERHDNIEAIYKKLQDRRDTADVTDVLKELHRIVNEAIRAAAPGDDHAEGLTVDLSQIDFAKLRDEFAGKVRRKHAALQDIRDVIEKKLAQMLARNPIRMDYYKKYQEIIADYNREKDRTTVETIFAELVALAASLDAEQRRAAEEGLTDEELALFDLLLRETISKSDREKLKQASKTLLASLRELLAPMHDWTQNSATQAEVRVLILDSLWRSLPRPPFTDDDAETLTDRVYDYVWQRTAYGHDLHVA